MFICINRLLAIICLSAAISCACSCVFAARGTGAALVKMGLPGEDQALIDMLAKELGAAGYSVTQIDAERLCNPAELNAKNFDLLVLPNAAALPAGSTSTVDNYLKQGGDIIALNAPLWQRSLINIDGQWSTRAEYQTQHAADLPPNMLIDFKSEKIASWARTSNNMDSSATYDISTDAPQSGQQSLHAVIDNMEGWDNVSRGDLTRPFPNGHTLTVLSAKGGPLTSQIAVEWAEKDGSRWIATIPLGREWRQYILRPEDFHFWHSAPGRGGRGDHFRPENATRISLGLAFSHTGSVGGRHEWWAASIGTAEMDSKFEQIVSESMLPQLDMLSPGYKLFDVHEAALLETRKDQVIVDPAFIKVPVELRSTQPRPGGGGFDKRRDWRCIPLLEARNVKGEWRGTPAALMVHTGGPYKGGVWASFGLDGSEPYKDPAVLHMISQIAERMKNGVFILDGGANYYTYFEDQTPALGMRVADIDGGTHGKLQARITVKQVSDPEVQSTLNLDVLPKPGEVEKVSTSWKPAAWPANGYEVMAELLEDGRVIDTVRHEIDVWKPSEKREFMKTRDGEFVLNGKRWRAHGVNYMPSSGIGTEDGEYFEHWIGAQSYDPEVIERDLSHIQDMGLNAVSIFCYSFYADDQNLVDILRRLDKHGMKANVSLRPGTPMEFEWPLVSHIIQRCRLAENDTVFAYDIAWEPMFGTHEERAKWDGEWEKWVIERYGSISNAEKDWGFSVPQDSEGKITNPYPEQIDTDGKWRIMTAAYRRFLDTLLYKKYSAARRLVLSIDPNHLVSFRMAEAANPTYRWEGRIPYDFPYLAAAVDFLAPEAYGRIGDWEKVKPGWFEVEYARMAAPKKPMVWAEMGVSAWDMARMRTLPERLDFQAMFFEAFYKMLIGSGANGVFYWWYPGGFRYGENSDFGIINPDGTDRPVTKVIRDNAKRYLDGPVKPDYNYLLTVDRDKHPDGAAGIYDEVKAKFWAAIDKGMTPGLQTAAAGTDSSNCALVSVGNSTASGPRKYLDVAMDSVWIKDARGQWIDVQKGSTVKVAPSGHIIARIRFTNLGEAKLLPYIKGEPLGGVYVSVVSPLSEIITGIPEPVEHLESATAENVQIYFGKPLKDPIPVTITFGANGRAMFGERFTMTLVPESK